MSIFTIGDIELKLRSLMKGEYSSLTISFNDHACNYCDVKQAIEDGQYEHCDWVSGEERLKAIAANSVWVIQWYPDTPIGFFSVVASSLEACFGALPNQQGG